MKNTHMSVDEIKSWLDARGIKPYTINDEGTPEEYSNGYSIGENGKINVAGNVILALGGEESLPVNFGEITGDFICFGNKLTNLKGAPDIVGGNFICCDNQLTSLVGAPAYVVGDFACCNNQLTSVNGVSENTFGNFICVNNPLTTMPSKSDLENRGVLVHRQVIYHIIPDNGACDVFHNSKEAKTGLATSPYAPPVICQKVGFFGDENFDCTTCDAHSHCTQPEKNIKPHKK
jgi:hypothetical protein